MMETFEEMSKETNLKSLILESQSDLLKNVPARIFSKALNNLQKLGLYSDVDNSYTSKQMEAFFKELSHQTNLHSIVLIFPDNSQGFIHSVPGDILAMAICKLQMFMAPQLRFSENQIKSIFQTLASNATCDLCHPSLTQTLDLGSCHVPLFSLVDQNTLRFVYNLIKDQQITAFNSLLHVWNFEISIEDLEKVHEENNKKENNEEKLSDEEMSKRWRQLMKEIGVLAIKIPGEVYSLDHPKFRTWDVYRDVFLRVEAALNMLKSYGLSLLEYY